MILAAMITNLGMLGLVQGKPPHSIEPSLTGASKLSSEVAGSQSRLS